MIQNLSHYFDPCFSHTDRIRRHRRIQRIILLRLDLGTCVRPVSYIYFRKMLFGIARNLSIHLSTQGLVIG